MAGMPQHIGSGIIEMFAVMQMRMILGKNFTQDLFSINQRSFAANRAHSKTKDRTNGNGDVPAEFLLNASCKLWNDMVPSLSRATISPSIKAVSTDNSCL